VRGPGPDDGPVAVPLHNEAPFPPLGPVAEAVVVRHLAGGCRVCGEPLLHLQTELGTTVRVDLGTRERVAIGWHCGRVVDVDSFLDASHRYWYPAECLMSEGRAL
jgi:hypothetical protein